MFTGGNSDDARRSTDISDDAGALTADGDARRKRRRIRELPRRTQYSIGLLGLALLGLGATGPMKLGTTTAMATTTMTLNGRVSCSNGAEVTGIWVDLGSGTDKWAPKYVVKNQRSTALYSVRVTVPSATWVALAVGCGKNPKDPTQWASRNTTPRQSLPADPIGQTWNASCTGAVPTGTCTWNLKVGPEWPPLRESAMILCGDRTCTSDSGVPNSYHPYSALDFDVTNKWVYATGPGTVYDAAINHPEMGKYVIIKHPDGTFSRYLHLSEIGITKDTRVIAGTKLGISGNTGRSTGPHLHYDEQRPLSTRVDLGKIYSFGVPFSSTNPDRAGYKYPDICRTGVTAWSQVPWKTCAVLVNEGT